MSAPLTDRERCLRLEARVAELEEELAAWRGNDREDDADEAAVLRLEVVVGILRALEGGPSRSGIRGAARLLIYLLDHPGRLCRHAELLRAISSTEETLEQAVNVRVCQLRSALRRMGYGDAIETIWGHGYLLKVAEAPAIAKLVEPYDG